MDGGGGCDMEKRESPLATGLARDGDDENEDVAKIQFLYSDSL